jgi:H+/Cl- antiporter ClcA
MPLVTNIKWLFYLTLTAMAVLAGLASALFLFLLDWVTEIRVENPFFIWFLPLGGLIIGLLYHFYGKEVEAGNDLILERCTSDKEQLPVKMSFLIFITTLITHLFGGSAGREGTAVQMSGAIADQFKKYLDAESRQILIVCAISAGFSSVFGTPWAGAIFSLEIIAFNKKHIKSLFPSIYAAFLSHAVCLATGITHTIYFSEPLPVFNISIIAYIALAGIFFGILAFLFIWLKSFFSFWAKKTIAIPYIRPLVGGIVLLVLYLLIDTNRYAGLGIGIMEDSFKQVLPLSDSFSKIFFTAFTLGFGFKGGEVTPLFFIGATGGNFLANYMPVSLSLMAAVGFVAVFAGATNTPFASTMMGIEMFGTDYSLYLLVACVVATVFSGNKTIYGAQVQIAWKQKLYNSLTLQYWKQKI